MLQCFERFLLPSAVLAKLKTTKLPSLHWLFPLSATLLTKLPVPRRAQISKTDSAQDFVVIISLKYNGWRAHPNGESMQLETVENDTKALLDHLGYRHDTADGRRWYFLMDYDLLYEDESKISQLLPRTGLPTMDIILETLREATMSGTSGVIHYSGHCHCQPPGVSELIDQPECIIYRETEGSRRGPKGAYLISCDGRRIYGKDFYLSLQNTSESAGASTITVVLDTCKAEAFIEDFGDLSIAESADALPNTLSLHTHSPVQLVVVSAARADEQAWPVNNCGVLTYFLIECLRRYPMASAAQMVKYLNIECQGQPDPRKIQRPRIWSRYPLEGPFRLLRGSAADLKEHSPPSNWYSWLEAYIESATQYALNIQALRPTTASIMLL